MTAQVLVRVKSSSLTLSHLSLQLHSQSGVTMLTLSPSFLASFTCRWRRRRMRRLLDEEKY